MTGILTRAALAAILTGGAAFAQTTAPAEGGSVAVTTQSPVVATPAPAATVVTPAPSAAVVTPGAVIPDLPQQANDQAVAEMLLAQGFSDIKIDRQGTLMTVTGLRDGVPIKLVYNTSTGRLIEQDGKVVLTEEQVESPETMQDKVEQEGQGAPTEPDIDDGMSDGSPDGSSDDGTTDGTTDGGTTDGGSTDGGTTDGAGGGTSGGGTDGGDTGTESDGSAGN